MMLNGRIGKIFLMDVSPEGFRVLASAKVFEPGKSDTQELISPLVVVSGKLLLRDLTTLKCLDMGAK